MSNDNQGLDAKLRLYAEAAIELQEHAPIADLTNSLSRMYFYYAQAQDETPDSENGITTHHFFLLLSYLYSIDKDFPSNHADFGEVFTDIMLKYDAGNTVEEEEQEEKLKYRNIVDLVSKQGLKIDEGSLWERQGEIMMLVDEDEYHCCIFHKDNFEPA